MLRELHNSHFSFSDFSFRSAEKIFDAVILLDSNSGSNKHCEYDFMIALGVSSQLRIIHKPEALQALQHFIDLSRDWIFGYISYEAKDLVEELETSHENRLNVPYLNFFVPRMMISSKAGKVRTYFNDLDLDEHSATELLQKVQIEDERADSASAELQPRTSREKYLETFRALQQHIQRGDIYEINYCMAFTAENVRLMADETFSILNKSSSAPFSALMKLDEHYLISSSPERFIRKTGQKLISQPIKGTRTRHADPIVDEKLKNDLRNDPKEQTENVMIVDLVRNDLSRLAEKASVKVEELFGIYSFQRVHQMISTVSCVLPTHIRFSDIIRGTFPMGSMTGAPKISAMKLIDRYEDTSRGLYSGALGYVTPEEDFDFSVIIRSIVSNDDTGIVSVMTGSAITAEADSESEYEECMIKAAAMLAAVRIRETLA
jgi:para-aminobenzoate synthetase component 1